MHRHGLLGPTDIERYNSGVLLGVMKALLNEGREFGQSGLTQGHVSNWKIMMSIRSHRRALKRFLGCFSLC